MKTAELLTIAQSFGTAIAALSEQALRDVCTEDVVWNVPGHSVVSGQNVGVEGILAFQRKLHEYELTSELVGIFFGPSSVVAQLHETGRSNGKRLNVEIALLLQIRDGKIYSITGHISDVEMFSDYLS